MKRLISGPVLLWIVLFPIVALPDAQVPEWIGHYNFSNNNQKFDAYLFSWDKKKMAGTTYWEGRTFGFFAIKQ